MLSILDLVLIVMFFLFFPQLLDGTMELIEPLVAVL